MKSLLIVLAISLVTLFAGLVWPSHAPEERLPKNTYEQDKAVLETLRSTHASKLGQNSSGVLKNAAKDLCEGITGRLIPHWYGTAWDFNGITRTPGKGNIACGYFITTLAVDAGIQVERARLAQQPSSTIINALCDPATVKRHWKGYDAFLAHMRQSADGLYIVGLDFHCGFFLKDAEGLWFIHSNYINRKGVMKEDATESQALQDSKSFMSGCLSSNTELARKWLKRESVTF